MIKSMYPLFESIAFVDGSFRNPGYHIRRINDSTLRLFGSIPEFDPMAIFNTELPGSRELFKYRVMYNRQGFTGEFSPYKRRTIRSLKLVEDNTIEYSLKYSDRKKLEELYGYREGADEIIIVKNGLLTDTSYSNLLFRRGKKFYTPASPLLKGTARQMLIDSGKTEIIEIRAADLSSFESLTLLNAMNTDEDGVEEIPVSNIF
ncbi:MAG: aminotransferase class IV [Ignavibacteriales bacterium]|nr:aminotransferase class IV [Ignavibacteriales bacterium]MCF8314999.1 aminotransferase class IV [Ignavibacteriales bacterium]MCF8436005.1 aminotransferase class IV [Ignavibacteriales bacterium]